MRVDIKREIEAHIEKEAQHGVPLTDIKAQLLVFCTVARDRYVARAMLASSPIRSRPLALLATWPALIGAAMECVRDISAAGETARDGAVRGILVALDNVCAAETRTRQTVINARRAAHDLATAGAVFADALARYIYGHAARVRSDLAAEVPRNPHDLQFESRDGIITGGSHGAVFDNYPFMNYREVRRRFDGLVTDRYPVILAKAEVPANPDTGLHPDYSAA